MVEKKLGKYYWTIGVVAVTLVILVLASVFAIAPSFKSINKTSQELKSRKEELKTAEEKLDKLKELKVKEDELREQSQVVYRAIPSKKEVGDIFIQLDGLIKEAGGVSDGASGSNSSSGSSAGTGDQSSSAAPAGVSSLAYGVNATFPSYQSFKALLSNSERALRFVHLSSFKITSDGSFTVDLTYTAYYRNEQSVQTESEQPVPGGR
jgi:hypothetical protein